MTVASKTFIRPVYNASGSTIPARSPVVMIGDEQFRRDVIRATSPGDSVYGVVDNAIEPGAINDCHVRGVAEVAITSAVQRGDRIVCDASGCRRALRDENAFGVAIAPVTTGTVAKVELAFSAAKIYESTSGDMTLYVDMNADANTADGTQEHPFTTFDRAFDEIPRILKHDVRIKPAAGTYTSFPDYLDFEFRGGRLIGDASGEAYPKIAGPFTVDTAVGVGPNGLYGVPLATEVTVTGSPGWAANVFYNAHIHVLTGSWAGYCLPIHSHGDDWVRTWPDWYSWSPGDTFEIVNPPVTISVDHGIMISGKDYATYSVDTGQPSPFGIHLLLSGIRFDIAGGTLSVRNVVGVMSFCTVTSTDKLPLELLGTDLNMRNITDGTFDRAEFNDYYAYSFQIGKYAVPTAWSRDVHLIGSNLASFCCRRDVTIFGVGKSQIQFAIVSGINLLSKSVVNITEAYLEDVGASDGIIENSDGALYLFSAHCEASASFVLEMKGSSWCRATRLTANASNVTNDYALDISRGAQFQKLGANVTAKGQVGAIRFLLSGTTHANWPTGQGVGVTDSLGSWVVSES